MNKVIDIIIGILLCMTPVHAQQIPVPSMKQQKWHQAEMGAIFHYDLHVFDGLRYQQEKNRITPIADYNIFQPEYLDTDQWIQTAKLAGCRFAILTVTHETGFGLWQSEVNPYCLKALKWRNGKGDILHDFIASCRKFDLLPAIYIGIRWNSLLGIHNFQAVGDGQYAKNRQTWYKHYCERMVEELCSKYGDFFLIWFDGGADDPKGLGPDVEPIVDKYQPNCLFYHNVNRADFRWGGTETGIMAYPCWSTFPVPCSHHKEVESLPDWLNVLKHGDKEGVYWLPAMADFPLRGANGRHEWFWEPDDESSLLPLSELMAIYEGSVGRNAVLVVGLTPDPSGLLPQTDVERLTEWGKEIQRRWGQPLATVKGNKKQLIIQCPAPQEVHAYRIKEDLSRGERIRRYKLEAKVDGHWVKVADGESVGYQRLETIPTIRVKELRLTVTEAIASPVILDFSIF
ncbi:alpha-L-fucosidase [Bacteroides heparinolyticus]|uniref:alpha-L-fucosidase n=1 Tax=Prevotella heparinolytica TaxID=28113 RepID=UPI0035A00920